MPKNAPFFDLIFAGCKIPAYFLMILNIVQILLKIMNRDIFSVL